MTLLPANLALTNIAPNAAILSADHRTNYSAIQTYANAINALLGGGTSGQVLVSGGAGAASYLGGMVCVADSTLGAPAASFDFTGLPTTYAHLMMVAYLRDDEAIANSVALLRFNNDTAANYDWTSVNAANTTVSGFASAAQTYMRPVQIAAASSGANHFAAMTLVIPHYAGATNHKTFSSYGGFADSTIANSVVGTFSGIWRSTAAINRITLSPAGGNFVAGSRCSIYVMGS